MTDKQISILQSGLQLFATKGYSSTSTKEVAKLAGVSEALIFRHFVNKEGLLNAVLEEGELKVNALFKHIISQTEPEQVIKTYIELPFQVPESEYNFWRLLYTLKWEIKVNSTEKVKPLQAALTESFKKLLLPEPELEADFLIRYIDGLIIAILKGEAKATDELKSFLLKKYNVSVLV